MNFLNQTYNCHLNLNFLIIILIVWPCFVYGFKIMTLIQAYTQNLKEAVSVFILLVAFILIFIPFSAARSSVSAVCMLSQNADERRYNNLHYILPVLLGLVYNANIKCRFERCQVAYTVPA